MKVRPISLNAARKWIGEVHRHLREPITGWLFGVEILSDAGERIGVACAGRPAARLLQDGTTCEITRVAVLEGQRNACSFAYGALRKAAVALGYDRIVTYTMLDESGSSLRAAGFVDDGPAGGGESDRPKRRRKPVEQAGIKRRWRWGRPVGVCRTCGGRGWHTTGGNDPMDCGACAPREVQAPRLDVADCDGLLPMSAAEYATLDGYAGEGKP